MPIDALRSVEAHFDRISRHVRPKRLVREMSIADKAFFFKYFKGYRPDKIGRGRIKKIAARELFAGEGHELLANLVIIHWNDGNRGLYREMVAHVKTIDEDVEAVESIEDESAHDMIDDLGTRHAVEDILICVRLNGVRFSDAVIERRLVRGEPRPTAEEQAAAGDEAAGSADGEPGPEAATPEESTDGSPAPSAPPADSDA